MEKRYQPFFEMAYNQEDFERKILTVTMVTFYEHLVKLKLCDKSFSEMFHPKLWNHAIVYKSDWEKQSVHLCEIIFNKMREKKISKPGSMQKAYVSVLDNMDIEMIQKSNGVYNAIKRASSNFKYQKDVLNEVEDWVKMHELNKEDWFISIHMFMMRLCPKGNKVLSEEEIKNRVTYFVREFK